MPILVHDPNSGHPELCHEGKSAKVVPSLLSNPEPVPMAARTPASMALVTDCWWDLTIMPALPIMLPPRDALARLLAKLGARGRVQLVIAAYQADLVSQFTQDSGTHRDNGT